jgi:beta-lactamase regulating signal transducer with metallopeptidase domain
MNILINHLNQWAAHAGHFAGPMLWQSSIFIGLVYLLEFVMRKRVGANIRYLFWLLVLLKLLVPPSMASPTSFAWWLWPTAQESAQKPFTVIYGRVAGSSPIPGLPTNTLNDSMASLSIEAWGLLIWAAVGIGMFAFALKRGLQLSRQVNHAAQAPVALDQLLAFLEQDGKLPQRTRIRTIIHPTSPAVFGLFRPIILLPQSIVNRLSTPQLRAILLHELVHVRRRDVWVQCAQTFLQIIYWWHPLVWFANLRIRRVREEAVDDAVVRILRAEADIYPRTLLEVARLALRRTAPGLGIVGILESGKAFRNRIERLIAPAVHARKPSMLWFGVILLFSALVFPMGKAPARSVPVSDLTQLGEEHQLTDPAELIKTRQSTNDSDLSGDRRTVLITLDRAMVNYVFGTKNGAPKSNEEIKSALEEFVRNAAGINPFTGEEVSCYFNDRDGRLILSGTARQIELTEKAIFKLLAKMRAITLKASFVELPEAGLVAVMTDQVAKLPFPNIRLKNSTFAVKILSQKETTQFLGGLKKMEGADLKNSLSVTTRSGRQASINSVGLPAPELFAPKAGAAQPSSTSLDITPTLESDASTIDLQLRFLVTDFLGYDDPPGGGDPLPHYRLRGNLEMQHCKLLAGQSAVLVNPESFQSQDPQQKTGTLDEGAKRILVVVTATIVDEAGHAVPSAR